MEIVYLSLWLIKGVLTKIRFRDIPMKKPGICQAFFMLGLLVRRENPV